MSRTIRETVCFDRIDKSQKRHLSRPVRRASIVKKRKASIPGLNVAVLIIMAGRRLRNGSTYFITIPTDHIDWSAVALYMEAHKQILFIGDQHCHEFLSEAVKLLNPDIAIEYSPGVMGAFLYLTEIDRRKFPQLVIADLDTMSMNADSITGLIQSIPNVMNTVFMFLSKNLESWDITFWEKHGVTLFEKPFVRDEYKKVAQTIVYSII